MFGKRPAPSRSSSHEAVSHRRPMIRRSMSKRASRRREPSLTSRHSNDQHQRRSSEHLSRNRAHLDQDHRDFSSVQQPQHVTHARSQSLWWPWSLIKSTLMFCFGGRWLYVRWLNQPDSSLREAQRLRSRAPSWLRDEPKSWGSTLERERILRERQSSEEWDRYLNELDGDVSDEVVLTSATSATSETIALNPLRSRSKTRTQSVKGHAHDVEQTSDSETEMYLGPVGSDRPHYRGEGRSERQGKVDLPLVLMITCLMMVGLLMVYSSSIVRAGLPRGGVAGNPEYFFEYQAKFMMIGVVVMAFVSYIPYQVWGLLSSVMLAAGLVGLALVFSPVGKTVNGAHRWINIGINIQPIEFVKFAWILALCLWFGDRRQDMNRKYVFWCPILGLLPIIVMLGLQPDFGSTIIITFIFLMTFLISGGIWRHLVLPLGLIAIPGGFFMMYKFNHILRRLNDYLTVFSNPDKIEYNLKQALISFCSGRISGVGLGQSSQKEYFLPEAHTDFILAIFGAEYGFIGVILLVALYLSFFARCLYIARRSSDLFGSLAVTMIAIMFCVQAFINMAMAIGLLPTKGLTLPLISYGGSSLLITCFSLGFILNVSRYTPPTTLGIKMLRWASLLHPFPKVFRFFKTHPSFLKRFRPHSTSSQRG